jgi:hypothetical protein
MPASTSYEILCSPAPIDAGGAPDSADRDAALDHAISRALLARVASGELAGAVRIWASVPTLALSRLDLLRPGVDAAIEAARASGLAPIRRLSGGHAVILGRGSLCAGVAEPATTFEGTQERYERLSSAVVAALDELGIASEQGTLAGEWCPGAWSIRAGSTKLAGLAQRAVKGAAWAEAVVELVPVPEERIALGAIYNALHLELDPSTFGSVAEAAGRDTTFADLADPLLRRLAPGRELQASASRATLELAERYRSEFALGRS